MYPLLRFSLSLLLAFCCYCSYASHMLGGSMTYRYLGDTTVYGVHCHNYEIRLDIYQDCYGGQPEAIAQDNPAYLSVYCNGDTTTPTDMDMNVYYSSSTLVTPTIHNACGTSTITSYGECTLKKTFIRRYALPPNGNGYTVSYQRCCRPSAITNVPDPIDAGATYFCTIPGTITNNSAVFNDEPPQFACINRPMYIEHSATDFDGDSLTYELCPAYNGVPSTNIKPIPAYPHDTLTYSPSFSSAYPFASSPAIDIDAHTGIITGTPTIAGRYVLCICSTEWRSGVAINVQRREMVITVGDCGAYVGYKPFAGHDTVVYAGAHIQLHGADAATYYWSPGSFFYDSTVANPPCYFPDAGTFTFILHGVSDSGCIGTDTVQVLVLDHSSYTAPNAFTPNDDGRNDILYPIPIKNSALVNFRVYDRWGKLVFDGNSSNNGWDGTYHGARQPVDVYFWYITYIDNNGDNQVAKGNVTLLR